MGASESGTTWQAMVAAELRKCGPPWSDRLVVVQVHRDAVRVVSRSKWLAEGGHTCEEPNCPILALVRDCGADDVPVLVEDERGTIGASVAEQITKAWGSMAINAPGGAS